MLLAQQAQAQGRVAVEEALDYSFNNRALLAEALTHCSWPNPAVNSFISCSEMLCCICHT